MIWPLSSQEPPETPGFAYAVLTLTAFFLAGNHIVGRAVHEQIPPVGLSFWRWVLGVLILLPFALPGLRRHRALLRQHLGAVALLGAFMVADWEGLCARGKAFRITALRARRRRSKLRSCRAVAPGP